MGRVPISRGKKQPPKAGQAAWSHGLHMVYIFLESKVLQKPAGNIKMFLIKITTNPYCGIACKNQRARPTPHLESLLHLCLLVERGLLLRTRDGGGAPGYSGGEAGGSRDSPSCGWEEGQRH